jgi:gamma-glutamyltranspeptidase/glutathione hydrolase
MLLLATVQLYAKQAAEQPKVAIATAQPLATAAGFEVLAKGGNVFDAAVAVSAALAVVEPAASGLGGGGYWLLHLEKNALETVIDGREKAPLSATSTMFLNKKHEVLTNLATDGPLAAAIPGMPAGLVHLSKKYGHLPLSETLKPAIRLAENGFPVGERYVKLAKFRLEQLQNDPTAASIFLDNGKLPDVGFMLKQTDLANTLKRIAESGTAGFYKGITAEKLLAGVNNKGGIWTQKDLEDYKVVERKPLKGTYRGIKITTIPLSSAGGTVLIEALNILAAYDLGTMNETTRKHLIIEALRRAYHDRAIYMGDSDFVSVPVNRLINEDYAAGLRSSIRKDKATPSDMLSDETPKQTEGSNTTHFSIMDDKGNRVAATMSINTPFGAAFVAPGTGVVLNNEMDDFVALPGSMNTYGLIGTDANAIAPGKRMLSSMTPTFLETKDRVAVLGTPGGSKITSMVLLATLDFANGNNPDSWVKLPRFHHQYMPDVIEYEKEALSNNDLNELATMGHKLKPVRYPYGDMQAVQLNKSTHSLTAASDPRGEGKAVVKP